VRFLIDAQLPPGLAKFLAASGHQAEHVADVGLLSAPDRAIWDYAKVTDAVILTKDADFAALTVLSEKPQIVWLRFGNTRKSDLERRIGAILPLIITALESGDRLVEVN
jgi:predicted nuclease of predicted toxin-antitoxin system